MGPACCFYSVPKLFLRSGQYRRCRRAIQASGSLRTDPEAALAADLLGLIRCIDRTLARVFNPYDRHLSG